ncbi:MAG: ferredoxin reductase family protein [Candidatus Riflebacteria bacterium]|nr:ferredoxin reductase family protein [Candidatus Riflebacteria bacterium]
MAGWWTALAYAVSLGIPVWVWREIHPVLTGLDSTAQAFAWGRLCGLVGAVCLVWQILFISRVKLVEGRFGLDRLTRWHHLNAFVAVLCLLVHAPLVTWANAQNALASYSEQLLDFWRTWDDLPGAMIGLSLLVLVTLAAWRPLRGLLSYEWWYRGHLLGYLAVLLAFGHQVEKGKDFVDGPRWFLVLWYLGHGLVLAGLLGRRFLVPLYRFWKHRFSVDKLVPEAGDATSVYLTGRDLASFPARGGQFVRVRFLAPGFWWEAHPFSLSAPPDGRSLRLTVKRLGDFTRRLPDLPPGTPVLIDGPHGIFTAARATGSKVLLIAGGIGITPIRSILEDLLTAGKDVVLLYTNRAEKSIHLRAELEAVAAGRARLVHILSDDPAWAGEKGYLDEARLKALVADLPEREVFQCGPPPMMEKLREILGRLGVPAARVYDERFSL